MRQLYRVWSAALSSDQVERILACAAEQPAEDATIFSAAEDLAEIRSATVRWIDEPWVRDLLSGFVEQANREDFRLALDGAIETQVITYSAQQGDHYDWHHDVDWGGENEGDRKLSVTVQLSDPKTYAGGDLELEDMQTNADFRSKGTVVIFPSVLRHRVSPVTAGTRVVLVAWFSGPRWQ